jgi:predicted tellurium resistance membrane protein TerC
MDDLFTTANLIAFLTLTGLEIVLGIDNIIFIAILAGKLPEEQRDKARRLGITLAVVSRLVLLCFIGFVMSLKEPYMTILGQGVSGKDTILILGGLFLLFKAIKEIHHKVEHAGADKAHAAGNVATLRAVLIQVIALDVVFSLDSVITAVGLTQSIPVMVAAVLTSVVIMLLLSGPIVRFVDRHPAVKILALAFLVLIGTLLVAEGFHQEFNKGYVYFAMVFAVIVEGLQIAASPKKPQPEKPA